VSLLCACRHPREAGRAPATPPPPAAASGWARETLAQMSLAEKAAQMIGVRASGLYRNPRSAEQLRLVERVKRLGVGCVVVFESEVEALPPLLNALQAEAKLPLLVAADLERGVAFRIRRGVVPLPYAMAVGATGSWRRRASRAK
jgi:beta-glucosidase